MIDIDHDFKEDIPGATFSERLILLNLYHRMGGDVRDFSGYLPKACWGNVKTIDTMMCLLNDPNLDFYLSWMLYEEMIYKRACEIHIMDLMHQKLEFNKLPEAGFVNMESPVFCIRAGVYNPTSTHFKSLNNMRSSAMRYTNYGAEDWSVGEEMYGAIRSWKECGVVIPKLMWEAVQ